MIELIERGERKWYDFSFCFSNSSRTTGGAAIPRPMMREGAPV
jgi:hypothetical protein